MKAILYMVICCGAMMASEADGLYDEAASRLCYAQWRGETSGEYTAAVLDLVMPKLMLPTNGLSIRCEGVSQVEVSEVGLKIWAGDAPSEALDIRLTGLSCVEEAQDSAMHHVSHVAVGRYNLTTNQIGDVCLTKTGDMVSRANTNLVFTRNNVAAYVLVSTNLFSAVDIARQVDAAILAASTNAPAAR